MLRGPVASRFIESDHRHQLHPEGAQQLDAMFDAREHRRGPLRGHHGQRVRIERHHPGNQTGLPRHGDERPEHGAVPGMHSVEDPDRQRGPLMLPWPGGGVAQQHLHDITTSADARRPSPRYTPSRAPEASSTRHHPSIAASGPAAKGAPLCTARPVSSSTVSAGM